MATPKPTHMTPKQRSNMPRRRLKHGAKSVTKLGKAGQTVKYEMGQPGPTITRMAGRWIVAMPTGRIRYIDPRFHR